MPVERDEVPALREKGPEFKRIYMHQRLDEIELPRTMTEKHILYFEKVLTKVFVPPSIRYSWVSCTSVMKRSRARNNPTISD